MISLLEIYGNLLTSASRVLLFALFQYSTKSGLLFSIDKSKQDPVCWNALNMCYITIGALHFTLYLAYAIAMPYLTVCSAAIIGVICMGASYTPLMHKLWMFEKYREEVKYSIAKQKLSTVCSFCLVQWVYLLMNLNNVFTPGKQIGLNYLFWNLTLTMRSNQTFGQQVMSTLWLCAMSLNWIAVEKSLSPEYVY